MFKISHQDNLNEHILTKNSIPIYNTKEISNKKEILIEFKINIIL